MPRRFASMLVAIAMLPTIALTVTAQDERPMDRRIPPTIAELERALDTPIDIDRMTNATTFRAALSVIQREFALRGIAAPIVVNIQAFKEEDEASPNPYDIEIQPPAGPSQRPAVNVLKMLLAQLPSPTANYLVRTGAIEITTVYRARSGVWGKRAMRVIDPAQ